MTLQIVWKYFLSHLTLVYVKIFNEKRQKSLQKDYIGALLSDICGIENNANILCIVVLLQSYFYEIRQT